MADKTTLLVLDALNRAVAQPAGFPLVTNKKSPGLFAASVAGKQAAERCRSEGYIHQIQEESAGKAAQEAWGITEKGIAFLLSQTSPRQVLEELVRSLEGRHGQIGELVQVAKQWQEGLQKLHATVEKVLNQLQKPTPTPTPTNGSETWIVDTLAYLSRRDEAGASSDCPLPELYRQAQRSSAQLSIGHFHDGLRRLHEQEKIYLHPWTGPLYELPEPSVALLIGHEISYYVSRR